MFKRLQKLVSKREEEKDIVGDDLFADTGYSNIDDTSSEEEDSEDEAEDSDDESVASNKRKRGGNASDDEGSGDEEETEQEEEEDIPMGMTVNEALEDPIYIDPSNPSKGGVPESSCVVCPAARLKSEQMVQSHLGSKVSLFLFDPSISPSSLANTAVFSLKSHKRRLERFREYAESELSEEPMDPRDAVEAMDEARDAAEQEKKQAATQSKKTLKKAQKVLFAFSHMRR